MIRGELRRTRSGFTLLEVILASVITLVLMAALYTIMKMQLEETDLNRQTVERATLVRGVMNRLTIDLSICLSPTAPFSVATAAATSGTSTTASSGSSGTGSSSGGSGSGSGSGSSGSSSSGSGTSSGTTSGTSSNDNPSGTISYFAGVIGNTSASGGTTPSSGPPSTPDQLTIWVARVPDYTIVSDASSSNQTGSSPAVPSDIRRIDYWFVPDQGLARYESPWVSSDDVSTLYGPPTPDASAPYLIAPEVTSVMFEYWDPTNQVWQSQWDGSVVGPDGLTPTGPPGAIRVTLTLKAGGGEPDDKQYVQVIPVQTAPGSTLLSTSSTGTSSTSQ